MLKVVEPAEKTLTVSNLEILEEQPFLTTTKPHKKLVAQWQRVEGKLEYCWIYQ